MASPGGVFDVGVAPAQSPGRGRLSRFIHHPATEIGIIILILLSVALLVVEYSVELSEPAHRWMLVAGDTISILFAIELSIRFKVAKKKKRFFRRYWADILAILPLLRPLRFFRLVRLFRLFRLGLLLSRRMSLFRGILSVNVYELWVLGVITLITVIGAAVMAYVFESGGSGGFTSLEHSMWWALQSIIAQEPIGMVPQTVAGRLVTIGLMITGMLLFAVFTGVVSATMIDRLGGRQEIWEMDIDELEGHIVIAGWNAGVPPLIAEITADADLQGLPIVLLSRLDEAPKLQAAGVPPELTYFVRGDHTKLDDLRRSGIERASRAVVVADAVRSGQTEDVDARTVLAALTIERLCPGIYCVVELMDQSNESHLRVAGVEAIVMRSDLSGRALATACRHPYLVQVIMELVSLHKGKTMSRQPGPASATPFCELVHRSKCDRDVLVIGVEPLDGPAMLNPPQDFVVKPEDHLIVIGGECAGR